MKADHASLHTCQLQVVRYDVFGFQKTPLAVAHNLRLEVSPKRHSRHNVGSFLYADESPPPFQRFVTGFAGSLLDILSLFLSKTWSMTRAALHAV